MASRHFRVIMKGSKMKAIVVAALLALSFTTGFTCSKNQPEATQEATETVTTETTTTEAAPAVEGTEAAPAAEGTAAPATEEAPAN